MNNNEHNNKDNKDKVSSNFTKNLHVNRQTRNKTLSSDEQLDEEKLLHYFKTRKTSDKIFSFRLILLALVVLVILVFVGIIAEFLNQLNPINSLLKLTESNFSINIYDAKNVRLIKYSSETEEQIPIDKSSPILFEAIVALHGALEKKVNPQAVEMNTTKTKQFSDIKNRLETGDTPSAVSKINFQDKIATSNIDSSFDLKKHIQYIANTENITEESNELLKNLTDNLSDNLDNSNIKENFTLDKSIIGDLTTDIAETTKKIDTISSIEDDYSKITQRFKRYFSGTVCPIYTSLKDFSNYDCMYSYPNFILNNLSPNHEEVNNWVTRIINSSKVLKNYLLLDWIKRNVDLPKFFTMYFNSLSYGTYIIGLNSAADKFFHTSISDLSISQSVFLAKLIYDNNKNIYPNDVEITYLDIYERLVKNGIINLEDIDTLLHDTLSYDMSKERLHNVKYLSTLFNEGYKYYHKSNEVNIKTTFDNSIQNSSSQILFNSLKQSGYHNASIMILKKNKTIASYTMGINKKEEPVFLPDEPYVYTFTGIKPLIYLAALNSKSDISKILLESKYQSLIDTYTRRLSFYSTHKEFSSNSGDNGINLSALTLTDLDVAPPKLRNLFAKELYNLERKYLRTIPITDYRITFKKLGISTSGMTSLSTLLDTKSDFKFTDLVRAYSAFQTEDNAILNPVFISQINDTIYEDKEPIIAKINPYYIKLVKNLMLNKFKTLSNNKVIYTLYDNDTAYAFYDDYTIGIWIGNLSQQGSYYNSEAYNLVKSTLEEIIGLLY